MKKSKTIFITFFCVIFCFGMVYSVNAAPLTPKEFLKAFVRNYDFSANQDWYVKSECEMNLTVDRFNGQLAEYILPAFEADTGIKMGDLKGAQAKMYLALDVPNQILQASLTAKHNGNEYQVDMYRNEDNDILVNNDLIKAYLDLSEEEIGDAIDYLYYENYFWEEFAYALNMQLSEHDYQTLLLYCIDFLPENCLNLSTSKFTMQLDKEGLEETIYNLASGIVDDPEGFADMILQLDITKSLMEEFYLDEEEMREDILSSLEFYVEESDTELDNTISKEELKKELKEAIKESFSYISSAEVIFEQAVAFGGPQKLKVDLQIKDIEDESMGINVSAVVDSNGKANARNVNSRITINVDAGMGTNVYLAFNNQAKYQKTTNSQKSNFVVRMVEGDDILLDIALSCEANTKINPDLSIQVPLLTSENSLDISEYMAYSFASDIYYGLEPGEYYMVVNYSELEEMAYTLREDSKDYTDIAVPLREVFSALGYQVKWASPNQITLEGDNQIVLKLDQKEYTVGGVAKTLSWAPFDDNGTTVVPLSLLADEVSEISIEVTDGYIFVYTPLSDAFSDPELFDIPTPTLTEY